MERRELGSHTSAREQDFQAEDEYEIFQADEAVDVVDGEAVDREAVHSTAHDDDDISAQRRSILELLNSAFISTVPASQTVEAGSAGVHTARLTSTLTVDQVRMLLAAAQSRGIGTAAVSMSHDDVENDMDYYPPGEEEEDNDNDGDRLAYYLPWGRRRRPAPSSRVWFKPVTEPQEAGARLLKSGEFGRLKAKKGGNIRHILKQRESGLKGQGRGRAKEDLARNLVPNTDGTTVAKYTSNAYSGQYSADSTFYYTCCQDWHLHVYDTKAPFTALKSRPPGRSAHYTGHETTMKILKTVDAVPGSWTITDSHLSPNNERLIYASISSTVYMTKTFEPSSPQVPLQFSTRSHRRYGWDDSDDIGIYSCRFSADGNEVIAGGNGHSGGELRVYDLLSDRKTMTIEAHDNDVNSCCWADTASGNVLISASDDTFLKVWDRRSLGSNQKPSGVLVGHTEGITYVSAKGDGRYIVSNGKDQAMRLWDLRKMHSDSEFEEFGHRYYGRSTYDYRFASYPKPKYAAHPRDCSVMTYRGHQVFKTLIRCHFSPMETTGANYLYTGSSDGRIHVYSLDGRIAHILDRRKTLPISFDPSEPVLGSRGTGTSPVCVRDVNWHTQEPVIMSVGWQSDQGSSSVARHEWKGIGKLSDKMGNIEDYVEKEQLESAERPQRRSSRRGGSSRMPGSFNLDDD